MLVLLFCVLLVITFTVVYLVTKPTRQELDLEKRLARIESDPEAGSAVDPDILKRESYSDLPAINALLQRLKLAANIDVVIKQANSNWKVSQVLFGAVFTFIAVTLLISTWLHNPWIGLCLGLVAANAPYMILLTKRNTRMKKFEAILPDGIDLLGRALRAGHAVTAAIEMVAREIQAPVGPEFRRVFEEQNFGLPLREALLNLAKRVPVPDLQFLITAMLVQKETGGNLAEVLDKASAVIRERARLRGQLKIYTAQGRLTGWILGLLPFIVFGLMNMLNPDYARTLIDDPLGRKAIFIGLGLMVIGVWLIRQIVDIKV